MKIKRTLLLSSLALLFPLFSSCGQTNTSSSEGLDPNANFFEYEEISFVDKIGTKTNDEVQNYDNIRVNPLEEDLREDFAFGVDASMVKQVEDLGGVYYNKEGKEQDVFQILRRNGVNFVRFRLWVRPSDKLKLHYFGGGNNDLSTDIAMAKRAKAANLNVMIDFHYSDFWADPDYQNRPMEWLNLTDDEIPAKMKSYTQEALEEFEAQGITVDAVQIGNETNNGLCGLKIDWNNPSTSFDKMANMFKAGIEGAKSVFPKVRTIIHLANGGNAEEYKNYFTNLDSRGVNYDIIGASYYPHLSGSLDDLSENLNQISELTNKPVMVVETSWGFTDDYVVRGDNGAGEYRTLQYNQSMLDTDVQITSNSYSSADEEVGCYLTSTQAQATELRDIINVLATLKNQRGLGIFYWEPCWLPVGQLNKKGVMEYAGWATSYGQSYQSYGDLNHLSQFTDGLPSWSNQGLFSYTGKALPSLQTYSLVKEGKNAKTETALYARKTNLDVTINLAANETLPATAKVVTDFDAIRTRNVVWEASAIEQVKVKGKYTGLKGVLDGKFDITCTANCIENFIIDPGFENQGSTDSVKDPWKIDAQTPKDDKVVKLDRKKDVRNGKADLNWYHSTKDTSFTVSQTISDMEAGTYSLTTYILTGDEAGKITQFYLFYQIGNEAPVEVDFIESCNKGWSAWYQKIEIPEITLASKSSLRVGIRAVCEAAAWGHNDDWELITKE